MSTIKALDILWNVLPKSEIYENKKSKTGSLKCDDFDKNDKLL